MITSEKLYNKSFRSLLRKDVVRALKSTNFDIKITENYKYSVKTNSKDTTYVVIPDYSELSISDLQEAQAGLKAGGFEVPGTVGSVGSASSVGSYGCACTSVSTLSSAGSAGSVGTGG